MSNIYAGRIWFMVEGLAVTALGLAALVLSGLFASCANGLFALCFILTAATLCLRMLATIKAPGLRLTLFSFLVYLVAGIVLFIEHNNSLLFTMNYLGVIFLILAVTNLTLTLTRFHTNTWGFLLISSCLSVAVGALFLMQPADSSIWAISILFGGHFIVYGACQFMTGAAADN